MNRNLALWPVVLGLAGGLAAIGGQADVPIAAAMQANGSGKRQVQVIHRSRVDGELDVVVALGRSLQWGGEGRSGWWGRHTDLGVFLQRRDRPADVVKLALEAGPEMDERDVWVESASGSDIVLASGMEKGGPGTNLKYVFDAGARKLVKRVEYAPYGMKRLAVDGERVVAVGEAGVAIEVVLGGEVTARVLPKRVAGEDGFKDVQFGQGGRFRLTRERAASGGVEEFRYLVVEGSGEGRKRYRMPVSRWKEYAAARPDRVKQRYVRTEAQINESLGAWQVADGRLWVGKTFYDGEGATGVGGIGWFDVQTRAFRIEPVAELSDWSVTAMLVDADVVWAAVAQRGEWGDNSGGVLRWDRRNRVAERFEMPDVVRDLARVGSRIVAATERGVAILEDGRWRRCFVDEEGGGRGRAVKWIAE